MWKVGIIPDKLILIEFRTAGASLQLDTLNQWGAAFPEQLPEDILLALLLAQHAPGDDLADAGGRQIDPVPETVLWFRQVDAVGCEVVVNLVQVLAGRNDDPYWPRDLPGLQPLKAFLGKPLDYREQVFEALVKLAHFVEDESEGLSVT